METVFTTCPRCGTTWLQRVDFLSDTATSIERYEADFNDLDDGKFTFHHTTCGNTLEMPARLFRDLYNGQVYSERKTGTEDCPEYCMNPYELCPCPEECECAYIREIIQVIVNWVKEDYDYDLL